jgi:hypothetical protein
MRHIREDYNRIQDPADLIPEDEPVFLFRGQDMLAPAVLRYYAFLCDHQGLTEIASLARQQAKNMEQWPTRKYPTLLKKLPKEEEDTENDPL